MFKFFSSVTSLACLTGAALIPVAYAAPRYVEAAADFIITNDVDPGGLSEGDTVTWPNSSGADVPDLIFLTDAFSSIIDAVTDDDVVDGDDILLGAEEFIESGTISVTKSLNFIGRSTSQTIIDGNDSMRIFDIPAGTQNVSFANMSFQDGRTPGSEPFNSLEQSGAAVRAQNTGTLNFDNCRFRTNRGGNGSIAIRNTTAGGEVRIDNCTFQNNFFEAFGAGISMGDDTTPAGARPLVLRRLRMFNNNADDGAAIFVNNAGSVSLDRSDIADNKPKVAGSVWFSSPDIRVAYASLRVNRGPGSAAFYLASPVAGGVASLANLTISGNINEGGTGGAVTDGTITNGNPTNLAVTLANSTVFGNTSAAGDAAFTGAITVANSISIDNTGTTSDDTNASITDAGGNILGLTGGLTAADVIELSPTSISDSTFVYKLAPGSPAIDNGDNSLIPADLTDRDNDDDTAEPITFDQRGPNRLRVLNDTVDSGSYESLSQVFIAQSFTITTDNPPNGLNFGDLVTWNAGQPNEVTDLIFSAEAFTSFTSAFSTADAGATVRLAAGFYNRDNPIVVDAPLTLLGDPNGATTIAGASISRVIDVEDNGDPVDLLVQDLTLSNGNTIGGNGGAVRIDGDADVTATFINCTISGSQAVSGAAISLEGGAQLNLIQSTLHDNTAIGSGGALYVDDISSATLTQVTVTKNDANTGGGLRVISGGTVDLKNTLIVGNTATTTNPDLSGAFTSDGSNFIGDPGTATGLGSDATLASTSSTVSEVISTSAADNGGTTFTFRLPLGSPAINAGLNANIPADAQDIDNDGNTTEALPYDQRGFDFPRVFETTVDIGAYENSNNQPVLALVGDNPLEIECGSISFNDPGATATDVEDDDATLTAAIVVDDSALDLDALGTYSVTYDVTDSGGIAAETVTRMVEVVDTTAPVITLMGDSMISIQEGDSYTDEGATVADACDSTVSIVFGGSVNPDVPNTYTLTYDATDASSNVAIQVTRTVIVTPAPAYAIAADAASVNEGDTLTFTVSRSGSIDRAGSVEWALTLSGSVTADDFAVTSGTLNFAVDEDMVMLSINTTDDAIVELDEMATVTLSNALPAPATISTASASSSIVNDDSANVTVTDASIQEGNSGTSNLVFTLTLDTAVDATFGVAYATQTGTADSADFGGVSETVNFAGTAGETQQVTVTVNGDEDVELDETFTLQAGTITAGGRNVMAGDGQGTILNDDTSDLAIADAAAINEGDSGNTTATFNVSLDKATPNGFTIDWALSASDDVEADNGTLTFAGNAGEEQSIMINVIGDNVVELDETVSVTLSNLSLPESVNLTDAVGELSILNDDAATVSIADASAAEGDALAFSVTLSQPVDVPVTFSVSSNPATSTDFTLASGTEVTFEPGASLTNALSIPTTTDEVVEADETVTISLAVSDIGGRDVTLSDASATGTIINDDVTVLSITNTTVTERNSGTTMATFTVTSSQAVDVPFTVPFATSNIDTDSADFTAVSDSLSFAGTVGEMQSISISILGDTVVEADETFAVTLSAASPADRAINLPAMASGTGTITNDDTTEISLADLTVTEGDTGTTEATFSVTLAEAVPGGFQVQYTVPDSGSVAAGSGTLTFAGTTGEVQTFTAAITADEIVEPDETFSATISDVTGSTAVTIARAAATGSIEDDDQAIVTVSPVSQEEGDSPNTMTFSVSLSKAVDVPVSLDYTTQAGTAEVAMDFTATSGSLNPTSTPVTVTVPILTDNREEEDEAFALVFSNLSASGRDVIFPADTANLEVTGTIVNDDFTPVANPDSYELTALTPFQVTAANGFLANDTDQDDGQAALLSFNITTAPQFGRLQPSLDGSFIYTPDAGFPGTDRFVYEVNDGTNTASGTVTLTGSFEQPELTRPKILADGSVEITFPVTNGAQYRISFSANLESFQPLETFTADSNVFTFTDDRRPVVTGFPKGFYILELISQ